MERAFNKQILTNKEQEQAGAALWLNEAFICNVFLKIDMLVFITNCAVQSTKLAGQRAELAGKEHRAYHFETWYMPVH
jgi:hypothetical protein